MKQATNKMITAMLAIVLVFSALVLVLPGSVEASNSSSGDGKVMFNVIGEDGKYINGASWTLGAVGSEDVLSSGTTSVSGLGIAEDVPTSGSLWLKVSHGGVTTDANIALVGGEFAFTVVEIADGGTGKDVYGYFSEQVAGSKVIFVEESDYTATTTAVIKGNSFQVEGLDDGDYHAIMRVPGFEPIMVDIEYTKASGVTSIAGSSDVSSVGKALQIDLAPRDEMNTETHELTFGDNFNEFGWKRTVTLSFDVPYAGYGVSGIPLRMQIDVDNSGDIDAGELSDFKDFLLANHPLASTGSYLKIEGVAFESDNDYGVEIVGIEDSDGSLDPYTYTLIFTDSYTAVDAIEASDSYSAKMFNVKRDTPDLDRSYEFTLIEGYEVDSQVDASQYIEIVSDNYNKFTVDPSVGEGQETVGMTFKTYGSPTAVGGIEASDYAYAVMTGNRVKHYVVGMERDITFTAEAAYDANGNPLKEFIWDFGNGDEATTGQPTYTYLGGYGEAPAGGYEVSLTVKNKADVESTEVKFKVIVDNVDPKANIIVGNENPGIGDSVAFSGMNSTDGLISAGDGKGVIAKWIWDFGDGSEEVVKTSSNGNVTKTFENEGSYEVTLTVVDVAGNEDDVSYTLEVLPAAKPKLTVQKVEFEPTQFEEGKQGVIKITVKNNGDASSGEFIVYLYSISGGETVELHSQTFFLVVAEDEELTVDMAYTFETKGSHRLQVSVQDLSDPRSVAFKQFSTLIVDEAGWKNIAIFVGIVAVIGIIVALFYYRNRLPGRDSFKKGGPREPAVEAPKPAPAPEEEPRRKSARKSRRR